MNRIDTLRCVLNQDLVTFTLDVRVGHPGGQSVLVPDVAHVHVRRGGLHQIGDPVHAQRLAAVDLPTDRHLGIAAVHVEANRLAREEERHESGAIEADGTRFRLRSRPLRHHPGWLGRGNGIGSGCGSIGRFGIVRIGNDQEYCPLARRKRGGSMGSTGNRGARPGMGMPEASTSPSASMISRSSSERAGWSRASSLGT